MPGTTAGVYAGALDAGTEVSSTYEGRHLTVRDDELIHPVHADAFVNKGDPVILCDAGAPTTYGVAVGVALVSGTEAASWISVDTEGIFNLPIYAEDDDGNRDVEIGDQLYIRAGALPGVADLDGTGDAEISKISNSVTQVAFGIALGSLTAGGVGVIAIKVHKEGQLVGNVANKGADHVQGSITNPIEWGTTIFNVKQTIFNVGILTDYISGIFIRAYAEEAVPAGGIQGLIYSRITAEDDVQDMYAIRARTDLVMDTPGAHIANMVVGGMFSVTLDNVGFALTLADKIKALDVSIGQSATSTITTGSICGIYVAMNGILTDNAGRTAGIYIYQGGGGSSFPDYGIHIVTESANVLAAIYINSLNQDTPAGIIFETSGGFGYVTLLTYDGPMTAANCEYFLTFTAAAGAEGNTMILEGESNNDADADFAIRVRLAGDAVDRVIRLYEA